jgi:NAD(P)H-flavin reductase
MEILAELEAVEALPDRVLSLALRLRSPAPPMAPGQYVCIGAPGEARLPLSLASDPADLPALTLHFQPTPGHSDSAYLLDLLEQGAPLAVDLPHGECAFAEPLTQPLLLLGVRPSHGAWGIAKGIGLALSLAKARGKQPLHRSPNHARATPE